MFNTGTHKTGASSKIFNRHAGMSLVEDLLFLTMLNKLRCQLIWMYTVCKGRAYPGPAVKEEDLMIILQ